MANMWDAAAYDGWQQQLVDVTNQATNNINMLSSAIGSYKSQRDYNQLMRELTAATNESNEKINQRNLDWEREKLKLEQDYASFANQLAMAKSAGVNPYTALSHQTSSPAGGTPNAVGMQTPQQVVEDGFANGLKDMARLNTDAIGVMARARKDNADATQTNIDNIVRAEKNAREMEGLGLDNVAKDIRNQRDSALYPLQIENQELANVQLDEQNALLRIQAGLERFNLNFLKPAEYNQLLENTKLVIEKQMTEVEYRKYLDRIGLSSQQRAAASYLMAQIEDFKAHTDRLRLGSDVAKNYAVAKYYNSASKKEEQMTLNLVEITELNNLATRMKRTENDIYQEYARFNAWFDYNILSNKSQMSEYQVRSAYLEYLLNGKKLDWYDANQIVNALIPLKYGAASKSENISGQTPVWERVNDPYNPSYKMRSDGLKDYGSGVYEDDKGWIYDAVSGRWTNPLNK